MKVHSLLTRLATTTFVAALCFTSTAALAQMQGTDKRKQTTIQTVTVDNGKSKDAVTVKFLNLPWGEKTFSFLEVGGNSFYSTRDWPFAHVKLAGKAKWIGADLEPGDYAWVVTPKSEKAPMGLSLWKFTPGASGTFLVAGDVFTERPADAVMVASKPIVFERDQPLVDHLDITASANGKKASIVVRYGTRSITEELSLR